jgi:hypothetical protein
MINESTMFNSVAIRTDKGNVVEGIIFSISVFVVKAKNFWMLGVPTPLASIDGPATTLKSSLKSIRGCPEWCGCGSAFLTTKPFLVRFPSSNGIFLATGFACCFFFWHPLLRVSLSSAFWGAVALTLLSHEFLFANLARALTTPRWASFLCPYLTVAAPGTILRTVYPRGNHVEFFAACLTLICRTVFGKRQTFSVFSVAVSATKACLTFLNPRFAHKFFVADGTLQFNQHENNTIELHWRCQYGW